MSAIIEQGNVETKIQNGIATVEFSHPMSNSLPGKILKKLADEIYLAGENKDVKVLNGKWGPYISVGNKNAKVPKDKDPKELTLEECLQIAKDYQPKGRRKFFKKQTQ